MIIGKHIFRSIKKHPSEPIVIMLIVSLCVAIMILSVALPIKIYANERADLMIDEWTADLEISLKANSEARLIYEDDVESIIGERGEVIGEFSLTGFYSHGGGKQTVDVGAFDLTEADSFFALRYIEYGKITNKNIDKSAVVAKSFADEYGISLGDAVKLNILGNKLDFTVEAIALETGIIKQNEILVDISSIKNILAERSPIISALPSDFLPSTRVHVKVNDGFSAEDIKEELEGLESFADKRVELSSDISKNDYIATVLTITAVMPALLLVIVAIMMVLSSFELLQKKRGDDLSLFKAVGADTGHLNLMLFLECGLYGVVGALFGSVLSIPLMSAINRLYNFKYERLAFGVTEALIGFGSALILAGVCTFLYINKQRKKSLSGELASTNLDTDSHLTYKKLILAVPIIPLALVTALIPARHRYIPAFTLLFVTVTFIYVISPFAIGFFASLISRLLKRKKRGATDLILATSSCSNSYPLRHAGRITTLILTVFISLGFVLSAVEDQLYIYTDFIAYEYTGVGADAKTRERLRELDGVVATADAVMGRDIVFETGNSLTAISAKGDVSACFKDTVLPKEMPKEDNLALSRGVAIMLGAKVGDRVKCEICGIPCELTVSEIINTRSDFAFYDADYLGIDYSMLCVVTDGSTEAYESMVAIFDENGVECTDRDSFSEDASRRVFPQLTLFKAMFYAMILISLLGVVNVLREQSIKRADEFRVLRQNGKTKYGVLSLQLVEVGYLVAMALLLSPILAQALCLILDCAGVSFGMKLCL